MNPSNPTPSSLTVLTDGSDNDSPQLLFFLFPIDSIVFMVNVLICVSVVCLISIVVPCVLSILYPVADQKRATKEKIAQLPKYKFKMIKEFKIKGDTVESSRGVMTKYDSDSASKHVIALEDAECCICLSSYEEGTELRKLACNHHYHCTCIDKWLLINAICPRCTLTF